jgi:hypothetical protein
MSRIHRAVEHHLHLLDDGHLHPGAGELQHRRDRRESLGRLVHLLHDVLEAVSLAEQAPRRVVAAERRLARRDQVAEPGETLQRLGLRAVGDGEVGHLHETAGDDGGLRVLAVADAVDDADGDGDEVLQHTAELGADDIGVHERAEVAVARAESDRLGRLSARRGDDRGRRLLPRDLEGEVRAGCHGDAAGSQCSSCSMTWLIRSPERFSTPFMSETTARHRSRRAGAPP